MRVTRDAAGAALLLRLSVRLIAVTAGTSGTRSDGQAHDRSLSGMSDAGSGDDQVASSGT